METVVVRDPRINVKADVEQNHMVFKGPMRATQQVHPADSYDLNQALWTIYPPSTRHITDRLMRVRVYLEVKADADFQLGSNDGPRQFPIHSITDVLTVQVNGETLSDNSGDKLHAMLAYGNTAEDRVKTWSTTAAMPDMYQQYSDWQTYGSARNPLAEYGENSAEIARGGFDVQVVDARTLRYVFTEPIMVSPFYSGLGLQEEGFANVNQFQINYRWKSDIGNKVWSHSAAGNAITAVTATFYQAPEILTTFLTPDLTQEIPLLQTLPYHKPQEFIKSVPQLAAGQSTRVVSDSIKLNQVPRRMYFFVRRSRQTSTFAKTNTFARIDRISLNWVNQAGLLTNATSQDLYEMSIRNGLNMSWVEWSKHRGGVLCIELGKDVGLPDDSAPGVQGQYGFQVELDITNLSGEAFDGEFYSIALLEGVFQISENSGYASLGNLTPELVLDARNSPELSFDQYENLKGGGFFSSLKSFVNKIARGVQAGADVAEKVLPGLAAAMPQFAPVAAALPAVRSVAGAARRATGGRLAGGQIISRAAMRRR